MKVFSKSQSGLGAITVLIVIVAVAVVAATGWFVYENGHKSSNNETASTTAQPVTQQKSLTDNAQQAQTTQQNLSIKEWGIQLPLSDSIKDAYYVVGTSFSKDSDGLPSGVFLGLSSLTDPTCNPTNNNVGKTGAVGAILRFQPTDTDAVTGKLLTQKYPGTLIGDWYYGYQSWLKNNPCTQTTTITAADSAFATAAKSVTASSN